MRLAALLAVTLVLAGCSVGGTKTTTTTRTVTVTRTVTTQATPGLADPTSHAQYFGTIESITEVDPKRYLLVLKPRFFLGGVTANVAGAAAQGTTCEPLACPPIENDYWVLPAGSTTLTFILPATTTGTVLSPGLKNRKITAANLASIVAGSTTAHLMEPIDSGVWLAVDVDTVTSFAQQYQP